MSSLNTPLTHQQKLETAREKKALADEAFNKSSDFPTGTSVDFVLSSLLHRLLARIALRFYYEVNASNTSRQILCRDGLEYLHPRSTPLVCIGPVISQGFR